MKNIAFLAAAAALVALPASAESIRISTVGKTPQQVRNEVFKAAYRLCTFETIGATFRVDEMRACVDSTTRATFAQSPELKLKFAQR